MSSHHSVVYDRYWPAPDGPWRIRLSFALVGGRVECTSISLDAALPGKAARLTPSLVKSLPLASMLDDARSERSAEFIALVDAGVTQRLDALHDAQPESLTALVPRGRPRLRTEVIREVALVYLSEPRRPTTAVAEHFDIHASTAIKWIRRARELGLIPPKPSGETDATAPIVGTKPEAVGS